MAQVSITQLPQALALTGLEPIPIVQNGVTVQTTTGAISGAGALNYPFLTVGSTAGLTQARYIATNAGLSLTDNGAGNTLQMNLIGAALSLNSSGNGIQVKTGLNTVTNVSLAAGTGLSATNADGTTGNPTISLGTALQQFVSLTGTGMLAIQNGLAAKVNILGTTSQTSILNGNGAGDVTVGIADNPIFPGTGSATLPNGTTAQRSGSFGAFRYNTSLSQFEGYTSTGWNQFSLTGNVTSFNAGTTGLLPNTDTTGAVTLSGTLNVANGGTGGTATPTAGTVAYGNGTAYAFTAAGTSGQVLTSAGAGTPTWTTPTTGTMTAVSVATANGLAGTSSGGATPVLTLSTTITGVLKGNGTAISAATSGTDYAPATSGTSILYGNGSGGFSNVTIGSGISFATGTLSATGSGGTVTSVAALTLGTTGTDLSSTVANGTTTPVITLNVPTASATNRGALSSTDWTTFNNKGSGTVTSVAGTGTVNGITLTGTVTSSGSLTLGGTLGSIANSQLSNSTISGVSLGGNLFSLTAGTGVSFSAGTTYNGSAAITITATGSGGTVTSVTGTAPVVSSGGTTPAISMAAATTSVNGYLTSTDWTTFNGKQAALVSGTNIKTVNGTTLLGSGDLGTITYAYGGTGQTTVTTGDLLYGSASNVWSKLGIGTTGQILRVVSGAPAWGTDYVGTVTSVGWTGGIVSIATATTTPAFTIAGTSGGIPYFSSASTWATSAALTANAIVLGGGAGASPSVLASLGTTSTVLHGNAAGAPTFGAVSLTADVSGTLPVANGGTNITSYAVGDIIYASATTTLSKLADVATGNALISGGVTTAPSWGKIGLTTHVSGTLPIANGGTNSTATATAGGAGYGTGTAHAYTAAGTAGQVLTSAGASAPTWSGIAGGTF